MNGQLMTKVEDRLEPDVAQQLRAAVRHLMDSRCTSRRVREVMASDQGLDRELWRTLTHEIGVMELADPDQGSGLDDVLVVAEELGRRLACVPYSTSIVALMALRSSDACENFLDDIQAIASGERIAGLVFGSDPTHVGATAGRITAKRSVDGWRLSGRVELVPYGHLCDVFVVFADSENGSGVFLVDGHAQGVTARQTPNLDETRRMTRIELDNAPAQVLTDPGASSGMLERSFAQLGAVLAAESVGGTARCLAMTVEYSKVRTQFGRPIGSFQSIKHRLADLLVDLQGSRALVRAAALAHEEDDGAAFEAMASLAKSFATDTYGRASNEAIQLHGGIGFTWEHDAHLYLKRATVVHRLAGDAAYHREHAGQALNFW
ncbi:MAG: acyl-CoA dehydrogenase domain protein [Frankiales bacterium]|nr:acyl-CoA dehydrogenase domain protein [Frankiales bacterium]